MSQKIENRFLDMESSAFNPFGARGSRDLWFNSTKISNLSFSFLVSDLCVRCTLQPPTTPNHSEPLVALNELKKDEKSQT